MRRIGKVRTSSYCKNQPINQSTKKAPANRGFDVNYGVASLECVTRFDVILTAIKAEWAGF